MPKYEVYIKPEHRFTEVEAQSDVAARTLVANQMRAFLEADHFESCNLETDDGKDKPLKISFYGFCPICGADGVSRERRLDGNDKCSAGHTYPSGRALLGKPTRGMLPR